jgi:PPOX class probable F420-dependent enzyme
MARRQLSDAERSFVEAHRLARVATVDPDGVPHVVPVMYAFAEGAFWFSSDPGDRKARNLRSRPSAALVVDEPPPVKAGVTVTGQATVIEDGEEFERAQDILAAAGAGGKRRRAPGEQVYVRLEPDDVAAWKVAPQRPQPQVPAQP